MNDLIGVQIKSYPSSPDREKNKFPVIISITTQKEVTDKKIGTSSIQDLDCVMSEKQDSQFVDKKDQQSKCHTYTFDSNHLPKKLRKKTDVISYDPIKSKRIEGICSPTRKELNVPK